LYINTGNNRRVREREVRSVPLFLKAYVHHSTRKRARRKSGKAPSVCNWSKTSRNRSAHPRTAAAPSTSAPQAFLLNWMRTVTGRHTALWSPSCSREGRAQHDFAMSGDLPQSSKRTLMVHLTQVHFCTQVHVFRTMLSTRASTEWRWFAAAPNAANSMVQACPISAMTHGHRHMSGTSAPLCWFPQLSFTTAPQGARRLRRAPAPGDEPTLSIDKRSSTRPQRHRK
jgi:hypothetical protein